MATHSPSPLRRHLPYTLSFLGALLLALVIVPCAGLRIGPRPRPRVREYNLTISYGFWAPDCVNKQVILVNGQYPGPTIWGVEGETLRMRVTNNMIHTSLSVHWHGIRQLNNNLNDGAAHVTQCPLGPLETLVYTFVLDKAGTYFYHGHLGIINSGGLHGMLLVYEKGASSAQPSQGFPVHYDSEHTLLLNDWYHLGIDEQVAVLQGGGWVFGPQSLLLNGRGRYNCSLIPSGYDPIAGDVKFCNATNTQCGRFVLEVEQGKVYRLRIASVTSLVALNVALEGHSMTVVSADAQEVQPFQIGSEGLDIFSGQTTDVIFTANQAVGNYWIRTALFGLPYDTPYGLAIIRYKGAPQRDPTTQPPAMRNIFDPTPVFNQHQRFKSHPNLTPVPRKVRTLPFRPLLLTATLQSLPDRSIVFAFNNISLQLPATPFALGLAAGRRDLYLDRPQSVPFTPYNYTLPMFPPAVQASSFYTLRFNSYVDVVIQTISFPAPEYHPFHLHGHHFWVLGVGAGTFNATTDPANFNFVDPPLRFTVSTMPGGWAAIRFKADNPGAWLLHCHIEYHLVLAMQVVFVDGYVLPVPKRTRKCGELY